MNIVTRASEQAKSAGGGWLPPGNVEALCTHAGLSAEHLMLDLIPLAKQFALPELSSFHVGAVAQGGSGALYFGANIEFAGGTLGDSIHAEQATIVNALLHNETSVSRLAVSAAPCGVCRQFLFELVGAEELQILRPDMPSTLLPELLPGAFGPADLGIGSQLLGAGRHYFDDSAPPPSAVAAAALEAAQMSYAPYTGAFAGVGLATRDGRTFCGPYIENAAFNPSISPMQAAIVAAVLGGASAEAICEALLVEVKDSRINHAPTAARLLQRFAPPIKLATIIA